MNEVAKRMRLAAQLIDPAVGNIPPRLFNEGANEIDALAARLAEANASFEAEQTEKWKMAGRLAEAERLILRMSGEGFDRAKMYVEKYDLTGERADAVEGIAADQPPGVAK
jgi:hypothetical protein